LPERQCGKGGLEAFINEALEALKIIQIDAEPLILFGSHIAPEVREPIAVYENGSLRHHHSLSLNVPA
jgi:hypothetical protein